MIMAEQKENASLNRPVGTVTELNKPNFMKMAKGLIAVYTRHGTTLNK